MIRIRLPKLSFVNLNLTLKTVVMSRIFLDFFFIWWIFLSKQSGIHRFGSHKIVIWNSADLDGNIGIKESRKQCYLRLYMSKEVQTNFIAYCKEKSEINRQNEGDLHCTIWISQKFNDPDFFAARMKTNSWIFRQL